MSTKISIQRTGEVLDVSEGMNVEFKITSPIFSEQGSQTISDTLPDTPRNRRILGFPGRVDIDVRTAEKLDVLIEDGSFRRCGELAVQGVDEGIRFNVGLDEGIMYAFFKNKTIKELDTFPVMTFKVDDWKGIADCLLYLFDSRYYKSNDLTIFPTLLYKGSSSSQDFVANRLVWSDFQQRYVDGSGGRVTQVINGTVTQVDTPAGYGISPYPRVWKILEIIFDNFGYTITENPFRDDFHLKLLTTLHNCVDAVCFGKIDYRHIMPDVKIQDFLDSLFYKFGALFYVNSNDRTVRVRLIKDVLSSTDDKDYTQYKGGRLIWSRIPPKQLRLKMKTSFDRATPPADTYEEFLEKYNYILNEVMTINLEESSYYDRYVLICDRCTGEYYRQWYLGDQVRRTWLGSDFFNWDKKHSIEYEDYEAVDECVPTLRTEHFPFTMPYYPVGYSHVNTQFESSSGASEEKEQTSPLAFVFYWGYQGPPGSAMNERYPDSFFAAGSFNRMNLMGYDARDYSTGKYYQVSLTARSLYEHYLKDWDKVLRYANQEYKGNFALSRLDCMLFDNISKITIDNQAFLPAELSYSLLHKKEVELIVRSIKPLSPFDFSELDLPVVTQQIYYWSLVDTFESAAAQAVQDLKDKFNKARFIKIVSTVRIDSPSINNIDWSPSPSQAQYDAQEKKGVSLYQGSVTCAFDFNYDFPYVEHTQAFSYEAYFVPKVF